MYRSYRIFLQGLIERYVMLTTHHHLALRIGKLYLSFFPFSPVHFGPRLLTIALSLHSLHLTDYQPDNNVGSSVSVYSDYLV